MVGETISRDKIAGKTKQRAHELLTIDCSDPNLTVRCIITFRSTTAPVSLLASPTSTSRLSRQTADRAACLGRSSGAYHPAVPGIHRCVFRLMGQGVRLRPR
jgi:hypothetical protein